MGLEDIHKQSAARESAEQAPPFSAMAERLLRDYPEAPEMLSSVLQRDLLDLYHSEMIDESGMAINPKYRVALEKTGDRSWTVGIKEGGEWGIPTYTFTEEEDISEAA